MNNILITGRTGIQHVHASDDARVYRAALGSKDFIIPEGGLFLAALNSSVSINIQPGWLIMKGRLAGWSGTSIDLPIASGTTSTNRIDYVIAEYSAAADHSEGTNIQTMIENVEIKILQGQPSSGTAEPPELRQDDISEPSVGDIYQMALWRIDINGVNVSSPIDLRPLLSDNSSSKYSDVVTLQNAPVSNIGFSPVDNFGNSYLTARTNDIYEVYLNGLKLNKNEYTIDISALPTVTVNLIDDLNMVNNDTAEIVIF